jgi:hypothetical protein
MIWVKRMALFVTATTLWLILTPLFISKERLCNSVIEMAAKEQVTFCYAQRQTSMIDCHIKYLQILYATSPVAKIRDLEVSLWQIRANHIRLEGIATSLLPPSIETITIRPIEGLIHAKGDFGTLEGQIMWHKRTIEFTLKPSSLMRQKFASTLRYFKFSDGKYLYVTSF